MTTTFIYGLSDPRDGVIRYVGKSGKPLNRLARHVVWSRVRPSWPVARWIRKLCIEGVRPVCEILEEVSVDDWKEAERRWITLYRQRGHRLLNVLPGGEDGEPSSVPRGNDHWNVRLTDQQVVEMRERRSAGAFVSEVAVLMGVSESYASEVCRGVSRPNVGGPLTRKPMQEVGLVGSSHPGHKLTDAQVGQIREMYATGRYWCRQLARLFGMSSTMIRMIVSGQSWKHLPVLSAVGRCQHPQAKLTVEGVKELRELAKAGRLTQKELAERFGITAGQVSYIVTGKGWKHAGGQILPVGHRPLRVTGVRCHLAKLSEEDVVKIRGLYSDGGWSTRQLAESFHVSQHNVSLIVSRRAWKHVA